MPGKATLIPASLMLLFLSACASTSKPASEIRLQETDFAYTPGSVTVSVNQPVTLVFENTGAVEHDFVIENISVENVIKFESGGHNMGGHDTGDSEYDLHVSTLPGETSTIEFTPTEAGTYAFFCTVEGHLEAGMIGKMVVVGE